MESEEKIISGDADFLMFLGGLNPLTTSSELEAHLLEIAPLKEVRLILEEESKFNKGFAFFTPAKLSDIATFEHATINIRGRKLIPQTRKGSASQNAAKRAFFGGLPSRMIDQNELRNIFL